MTAPTTRGKIKNRRRKKLVRLDLQLKVVFITLFVASVVLLINFQLSLAGLWSISDGLMRSGHVTINDLLRDLKSSTIRWFLLSVALSVPLAGFVGILYSFKFCGPIYKFKKYFTELRTGRWDERCTLRQGDDLQDVCEAINGALECFRDRVRKDHALLEAVDSFLARTVFTADTQGQDLLERIRSGLDEGKREFAARFPRETEAAPLATRDWQPGSPEEAQLAAGVSPHADASVEAQRATPSTEWDEVDEAERELEAQT